MLFGIVQTQVLGLEALVKLAIVVFDMRLQSIANQCQPNMPLVPDQPLRTSIGFIAGKLDSECELFGSLELRQPSNLQLILVPVEMNDRA